MRRINYSRRDQHNRNISIDGKMLDDMHWHTRHSGVNWSEVCRKAIQRKINALDKERR